MGDSCNSLSSQSPRSRSTSQRRLTAFRVRLAGGGNTGGDSADGSGGGAGEATGGGAGGVGGVAGCLGTMEVDMLADGSAFEPDTAALRWRRRRCRTRYAGAIEVGRRGVRETVSDNSCWPVVLWLIVKQAFSPLSMQRS
jgi:hypothetical protein